MLLLLLLFLFIRLCVCLFGCARFAAVCFGVLLLGLCADWPLVRARAARALLVRTDGVDGEVFLLAGTEWKFAGQMRREDGARLVEYVEVSQKPDEPWQQLIGVQV